MLSTEILPACFSIIFCEIARPSPVPIPTPLVVNPAVKILSRFSGGMPLPESLIFTFSELFSMKVEMVMLPVVSMLWHAFTNMFMNTWLSMFG